MAQIFFSYARPDKDRIEPLVRLLQQQGWSVWWDVKITPGKRWSSVLEKELGEAKCVVVVWSAHSVESDWVLTEAEDAKSRQILVPVLIDDVRIPLEFRRIETASLLDWDGTSLNHEIESLLAAISETIGGAPPNPPVEAKKDVTPPVPSWTSRVPLGRRAQVLVGIVFIVLLITASLIFWRRQAQKAADQALTERLVQEAENYSKRSPTPTPTPQPKAVVIFNNWNTLPTMGKPVGETTFTVEDAFYVTNIYNYHYEWKLPNPPVGKGMKLRSSGGNVYGPWEVTPGDGDYKTTWGCSPKTIIPAGTYSVIDPDPASWSNNSGSEYRGFSEVQGYAVPK